MSYIIDILLVGVLVLVAVVAARRGFFATLFDLAGYVISFVAAKICSSTFAPKIFSQYFEQYIRERVTASLGNVASADYSAHLSSAIDSIPDSLSGVMELIGVNKDQLMQQVSQADVSGENLVRNIMTNIATPVGTAVIRTILFVALTIVFSFVLKFVVRLLDKVIKKLPAIKQINSGLGFVLGAVKGILVVIIVALLVGVIAGLTGNQKFIDAANNSIIIETVKGLLKSISGYIPV